MEDISERAGFTDQFLNFEIGSTRSISGSNQSPTAEAE
jgi:hypothetical protein